MRTKILTTLGVLALAGAASYWTAAGVTVSAADVGPQMSSIGPLTFGPDGVLFAADTQAATIYALELGDKANGGAAGTQAVEAIDQKIAGLLGTDAKEIAITDMVVHPRTRNAYIAVRRGQGTDEQAGAAQGRRRRQDRDRLVREHEAHEGRAAERAERRHQPAARSAPAVDHRHGLHRRPPLHRRAVERRVRLEAALGEVSVRHRRQRHQRRDLPRQPRAARDALAGLRVPALRDQQHPASRRRLSVHAAGQVPGGEPAAGHQGRRHDDRRARQPQPSDRHAGLQEGRPRVPADVEHRARRDEDSDRRLRHRRADHRAGGRPRPAAWPTRRSAR